MRVIDFHSSWVRVVVEFFPSLAPLLPDIDAIDEL